MREIKFRIWWKNSMHFTGDIALAYFQDGEYFEHSGTKEPYVFMQYTGLKDKNGIEIYEGDVVDIDGKLSDELNRPHHLEVIEYIENAFLPRAHGEEEFIIVGNIYENPELISNR